MMKRVFLLLVAVAMFSCGQQNKQQQEEQTVETYKISQLVSEPMTYEDDVVRVEGTIFHVCEHSGESMIITQTDDDAYSIQVALKEQTGKITPAMVGNKVALTGTVKTYVVEADQVAEEHNHEGEEGDHECTSTAEAEKKLKEKGIDPNVKAYIELIEVEQL